MTSANRASFSSRVLAEDELDVRVAQARMKLLPSFQQVIQEGSRSRSYGSWSNRRRVFVLGRTGRPLAGACQPVAETTCLAVEDELGTRVLGMHDSRPYSAGCAPVAAERSVVTRGLAPPVAPGRRRGPTRSSSTGCTRPAQPLHGQAETCSRAGSVNRGRGCRGRHYR